MVSEEQFVSLFVPTIVSASLGAIAGELTWHARRFFRYRLPRCLHYAVPVLVGIVVVKLFPLDPFTGYLPYLYLMAVWMVFRFKEWKL